MDRRLGQEGTGLTGLEGRDRSPTFGVGPKVIWADKLSFCRLSALLVGSGSKGQRQLRMEDIK